MERVKDQYKHTLRQSPRLGPIRLKRRWLGDQGDSASLGSPVTRFNTLTGSEGTLIHEAL